MTGYKSMVLSKLIRVYKIYLAYNLYNIQINCMVTKQKHDIDIKDIAHLSLDRLFYLDCQVKNSDKIPFNSKCPFYSTAGLKTKRQLQQPDYVELKKLLSQ